MTSILELWSPVWRGVIGGLLGLVVFFFYTVYTDIYSLGDGLLPMGAFLAGGVGLLVGALTFCISRLLRKNIGFLFRVLVGTLVGFCAIAGYSYLEDALLYNTIKEFATRSLLVGCMFGAPAGALVRVKLLKARN